MLKLISIRTTFSAIHYWEDCPIKAVEYLKYPHRHLFYVTIKFEVSHNNRDIEFIHMKYLIDEHLREFYENRTLKNKSCEQIAEDLLHEFNAYFVSVYEDNENGGEIYAN